MCQIKHKRRGMRRQQHPKRASDACDVAWTRSYRPCLRTRTEEVFIWPIPSPAAGLNVVSQSGCPASYWLQASVRVTVSSSSRSTNTGSVCPEYSVPI